MQSKRIGWLFLALAVLTALLGSAAPTQMIEARLSNIERRIDQVQSRVDYVEREQRMSSLNPAPRSDVSQATVLELQRQQINVSQQVIVLEQKVLELNKAIDQLKEAKRDPASKTPADAPKKKT